MQFRFVSGNERSVSVEQKNKSWKRNILLLVEIFELSFSMVFRNSWSKCSSSQLDIFKFVEWFFFSCSFRFFAKEGRALLPGDGGRPADVFIPHWDRGKDTALGVTVINPLQDALVQDAATTPGHALNVAHKRKLDTAWEACNHQGISFIPLAAESLGAWHKTAVAEVKKLGSAKARHLGMEESTTIQQLFQKLSVCLMRGNAALFNNRIPAEAGDNYQLN